MHCLSQGQLNGSSRREITHAVVYKILNCCKYPTSKQIDVVASKIVEEFGKFSRDALGTGYVSTLYNTNSNMILTIIVIMLLLQSSWSKSIENRLKNCRRRPKNILPADCSGQGAMEPPSKKRKSLLMSHHQPVPLLASQQLDEAALNRLKVCEMCICC